MNITNVVIWADSCGVQNRNKENEAAILHFLNVEVCYTRLRVNVHLKYFERGHNEYEVDTIHHMIEAKKKNEEIFIPDRSGIYQQAQKNDQVKTDQENAHKY